MIALLRSRLVLALGSNWLGWLLPKAIYYLTLPVFFRLLTPATFGIVGIYTGFLTVMSVFYSGPGRAAARQAARWLAGELADEAIASQLAALEAVFAGLGLACGLGFLVFGDWMLRHWQATGQMPPGFSTLTRFWLAGAVFAQFLIVLYSNVLQGLQRQVTTSVVSLLTELPRTLGVLLLLKLVRPSADIFFIGQATAAITQAALLGFLSWRLLPQRRGFGPGFGAALRPVLGYSLSLSAASVGTSILSQLDRVVLGWILPLRVFGEYVVVVGLAQSCRMVSVPVITVFFPRLCAALARHSDRDLQREFQLAAELVFISAGTLGLLFAVAPAQTLALYFHDTAVVSAAAQTFRLLAVAAILMALYDPVMMLQQVGGSARFMTWVAALDILLMVPLAILLCSWLGMLGAGVMWVVIQASFLAFATLPVFKCYAPNALRPWLSGAIACPIATGAAVSLAYVKCVAYPEGFFWQISWFGGLGLVLLLAQAAALPAIRRELLKLLHERSPVRASH